MPPSTAFSGMYFMIIYGACKSISMTYSEAAYIDGANEYRVMFTVILPMVLPTLCTIYRSYFNALTRNAEAFSLIASRLQDSIFLTDDELYAVTIRFADNEYGNRQLALLTPEQKIRTAKELHYRYNASNQQIRRILKIDPGILSELFP